MKLYIPDYQKKDITELQLSMMEKELKELNEQSKLEEDHFDLKKVYSIKNDEGAETYFYIRNNTDMNLNLEGIPVHMMKGDRLVAKAYPDFKILGEIPSRSAVAFKVQFKVEDIYFPKYIPKAEIVFGGKLIAFDTVNTETENLPENMDYYQKEFLRSKIASLKNLRQDTIDINFISASEGEDRSLNIAILIRNGYSAHGMEVATLPIQVYNEAGVLIYTGAFESEELKVKKTSSKLFNIVLPKDHLVVKDTDDYSEFTVKFE